MHILVSDLEGCTVHQQIPDTSVTTWICWGALFKSSPEDDPTEGSSQVPGSGIKLMGEITPRKLGTPLTRVTTDPQKSWPAKERIYSDRAHGKELLHICEGCDSVASFGCLVWVGDWAPVDRNVRRENRVLHHGMNWGNCSIPIIVRFFQTGSGPKSKWCWLEVLNLNLISP